MTSSEIRQRFLDFFARRGHAVLPSAPLVPKNDPSVLFNTAGMQPLVPYLMGEAHPSGTRLVNCQKCVRTQDIDEVGDRTHDTFFEMLGNWSLGDYFKADAIKWSYEFLTSKEEGLGLDPSRLYITVFEGDEHAPKDEEAFAIWKQYIPEHRIYFMSAKSNWWSVGDNGPCGPDTEMFYDITTRGIGDVTREAFLEADEKQEVIEIWNNVFMEYEKKDGQVIGKLAQHNVDTGAGLERIAMVVQKKEDLFETDFFASAMAMIKDRAEKYDERSARIIADHARSALFIMADGIYPSNKDQGYILRRLLRRALLRAKYLGLPTHFTASLIELFSELYKAVYPEVISVDIITAAIAEEDKFTKTLESGLKEFTKGADPFLLATTYGFPIELTEELAREQGIEIDRALFDAQMKAHQDASRLGAEAKFKGGLASMSDTVVRLHTAHHLLLAALQTVLGKAVKQRGSNITEERLRIDFSFDRKLTESEKTQVKSLVNDWIKRDLAIEKREMPKAEAEQIGAEMEFGTKYADTVSVYFIMDENGEHLSKEFCGGPHVARTGELGVFKIQKEEASSAGIRRIKAILQ